MARFAARDAGRITKSKPIVLTVDGVQAKHLVPDEDSRTKSARESLDRMGSFGVRGCVPTSALAVGLVFDAGQWQSVDRSLK